MAWSDAARQAAAATRKANTNGGKPPLPGHPYHGKSDDQLRYIIKDASEAERASRGLTAYNPNSGQREDTSGKYADQVNDASSILAYRQRVSDAQAANTLAQGGGAKSAPAAIHSGATGRSDEYNPLDHRNSISWARMSGRNPNAS